MGAPRGLAVPECRVERSAEFPFAVWAGNATNRATTRYQHRQNTIPEWISGQRM
jgi:hypothetical protein